MQFYKQRGTLTRVHGRKVFVLFSSDRHVITDLNIGSEEVYETRLLGQQMQGTRFGIRVYVSTILMCHTVYHI